MKFTLSVPTYVSKEDKNSLWCESETQKQSHRPSSPRIIPALVCLALCLLFLPQHALTLNPLFMLPNQGWDTECYSNSMLPLLEEKASRESLEHPAAFLPWPVQLWARPSSGIIRGLELSTVTWFQDNSTPTFLEELLTKGFNHSVKRIQGQRRLEIKKENRKYSDPHFMRHFNSIRRTSTERKKSKPHFQHNSSHREGLWGAWKQQPQLSWQEW